MRKLFTFLAGAALTALLAGPVQAETELKLGHVGNPGSLYEMVSQEYAKRINEKLAGKYKVVVFGSSQLGPDKDMMQKLKLGQIDLSLPSTIMSSVAPEFGVFEMPYVIQDRPHMKRVSDELLDSVFQPAVKAKGYRILAIWENGFRHITNNVRPINKPEDLKGIKLRTPKGEWRVKMFQAYGANPTPMAFSEVFTALKTGVMDGQENPFVQIHSAKFQEVQKYLSLTGHVYSPVYLAAGEDKFSKLPQDVQKLLTDTARELQAWVYTKAAELDETLFTDLKAKMEVNTPDKDAFIKASGSIYEDFGSQVKGGKELIDKILSLRAKS
ncbi:MAG: TRAP transporter substrate-binding protein [Hyphomicrobiales bacterium]